MRSVGAQRKRSLCSLSFPRGEENPPDLWCGSLPRIVPCGGTLLVSGDTALWQLYSRFSTADRGGHACCARVAKRRYAVERKRPERREVVVQSDLAAMSVESTRVLAALAVGVPLGCCAGGPGCTEGGGGCAASLSPDKPTLLRRPWRSEGKSEGNDADEYRCHTTCPAFACCLFAAVHGCALDLVGVTARTDCPYRSLDSVRLLLRPPAPACTAAGD